MVDKYLLFLLLIDFNNFHGDFVCNVICYLLSNMKVETIVVLFTEYALGEVQGLTPFAAVAVVARVNVDTVLQIVLLKVLEFHIEGVLGLNFFIISNFC